MGSGGAAPAEARSQEPHVTDWACVLRGPRIAVSALPFCYGACELVLGLRKEIRLQPEVGNGHGHGNGKQGLYELLVSYRSGDMWAPRVEQTEALKVELSYFIDCVRRNQTPINDGVAGLRVVQLLEAADRSLKERGRTVTL